MELMSHQLKAQELLLSRERYGLFHPMGKGKTLTLLSACFKKETICLVVGSISALSSWQKEIKKWYGNTIKYVMLSSTTDLTTISNEIKLFLCSYDYIIQSQNKYIDTTRIEWFRKNKIKIPKIIEARQDLISLFQNKNLIVIADEAGALKHSNSQRYKAFSDMVEKLKPSSLWLATGTPVDQHPEDLWTLLTLLEAKIGTEKEFRDKYTITRIKEITTKRGSKKIEFIVGYKNLQNLFDILREHGDILDGETVVAPVAKKEIEFIYMPMELQQQKIYNNIKYFTRLQIEKLNKTEFKQLQPHIFSLLIRLAQTALDPSIIAIENEDTKEKIYPYNHLTWSSFVKTKWVLDFVAKHPDKRFIIWSPYTKILDNLHSYYHKSEIIDGRTSIKKRTDICERFQNGDFNMILANPAIGEGITLDNADYAIYLSRTFRLKHWLQSQDRIYRMDTKKDKKIIVLIAKDTVDEYIHRKLLEYEKISKNKSLDKAELLEILA